ncbi:unnamed protein product [Dibothriocephalus latus]|uniref:Uncharacterized protein n=1 Tax=Dibothriocephalus latus TaxID=60516 RepID=A0A3P7M8H9_DIBLA|nr:unnamed protein product [Dibothriocephalus latus]
MEEVGANDMFPEKQVVTGKISSSVVTFSFSHLRYHDTHEVTRSQTSTRLWEILLQVPQTACSTCGNVVTSSRRSELSRRPTGVGLDALEQPITVTAKLPSGPAKNSKPARVNALSLGR